MKAVMAAAVLLAGMTAGSVWAEAAAVAMDQATAKTYAEPYLAPGKPVWLVGLSFVRDTRRFVEDTVQQVK